MLEVKVRIIVVFQDPFWVGIYERIYEGNLEVSKFIFGSEPKDYEVYEFYLKNWENLKFSPKLEINKNKKKSINPKRLKKIINKEISKKNIGNKSWQALKLQQEENKTLKNIKTKEQKELEKTIKFNIKRIKKINKHKGK